jgi:cytidylate kinase
MQRELAHAFGGVLEGRDIGTRVVPETPHKIFLTARPEVRARRRFLELTAKGTPQPFEKVLAEMEARDRADSTREDSPLTHDESYVVVDTSELTVEEVVEAVLELLRRRSG